MNNKKTKHSPIYWYQTKHLLVWSGCIALIWFISTRPPESVGLTDYGQGVVAGILIVLVFICAAMMSYCIEEE